MSSFTLENLWKTMDIYQLSVVENIPSDLLCSICHELMIDPFRSWCGCRFCYKCINNSLSCGVGDCPRCSEMYLSVDITVLRDSNSADAIKNLIVKCPHELCFIVLPLANIVEHIHMCTMKVTPWPSPPIGSSDEIFTQQNSTHNSPSDAFEHAQFLFESIRNSKNDAEQLIQSLSLKNVEIRKLEELIERDQQRFEECRQENIILKDEMEKIKRDVGQEISKLTIIIMNKTNGAPNLTKDNTIIEINKTVERQQQELTVSRNEIIKMHQEIEGMKTILREMNLTHDFVWIIDNFSTKKGNFYDSHTFYKDNYTANLKAWIDGNNVHLYCTILKGDTDFLADWPMKHNVILSILNQNTRATFASAKFSLATFKGNRSAFNKPLKSKNDSIGSLRVSQKDIINTHGLLLEDSIMVSCSLIKNTH